MDVEQVVGLIAVSIEGAEYGSEEITFKFEGGSTLALYHSQDCCESVGVEEVIGDIADLIGSPLLLAEVVSHDNETPEGCEGPKGYSDDSYTWTFYKFATVKGHVTLRWFGTSNGYYSEEVCASFTPETTITKEPNQ